MEYMNQTPTPGYFSTLTPQEKAINLVYGLSKGQQHLLGVEYTITDVKIVWFCKTLQNWKAMVTILVKGGGLYEVTYNGDKEETYIDYYQKVSNTVLKDEDL